MPYGQQDIAWLHCFSLSMSVKDRLLDWTIGESQTYYLEHILGYGHLEDLLLSCHGFQFFLD